MSIEIRKATEKEIDILVPLFDAYRVFYRQPSDQQAARQFLQPLLAEEKSVVYLAFQEGQAVGFTQLYPFRSSVSMRDYWVLNDLYVAENARRSGAARKLMDAAIAFARSQGSPKLVLETAHDNYPARALYDDYGFIADRDYFTYTKHLED